MIKSLLAAGALAASLVLSVPATQAQAGVDIDIHIGVPGYYPLYGYGYGYYPVLDWSPVISCRKGKNIVKWNGFRKVNPVDCALPAYKYTAWKAGHKYLVVVNRRGAIAGVERIF